MSDASDRKRAEAWALVEEELRAGRFAVGEPYVDDFVWTHVESGSLLEAVEEALEKRGRLRL